MTSSICAFEGLNPCCRELKKTEPESSRHRLTTSSTTRLRSRSIRCLPRALTGSCGAATSTHPSPGGTRATRVHRYSKWTKASQPQSNNQMMRLIWFFKFKTNISDQRGIFVQCHISELVAAVTIATGLSTNITCKENRQTEQIHC